jgi:MFS family permease
MTDDTKARLGDLSLTLSLFHTHQQPNMSPAPPVTKSQLSHRWLMLLCACLVMACQYYTYDNPSALNAQLSEYFIRNGIVTANASDPGAQAAAFNNDFNLMYSCYSWPNIILPLFGGLLISKFGARLMLMILITTVFTGQLVVAAGLYSKNLYVILLGRVIFGVGGETLSASISTVLAQWFKGKELALSMGVSLSISRLGSVLNDVASTPLASAVSVPGAFLCGAALLLLGILFTGVMFVVDRSAEKRLTASNDEIDMAAVTDDGATIIKKKEGRDVKLSDIKHFSTGFWLIALSCIVVYGTILPFNNIAQGFLLEKYFCAPAGICCPEDSGLLGRANTGCDNFKVQTASASKIMGVPFLIGAVLTPFLGGIIDKIGKRAILISISSGIVIFVHCFLWLSPSGLENVNLVYYPLIAQGVGYSVYAAALWPSIPHVVDSNHIGTAFGVTTAIQNCGLTAIPAIVAALHGGEGASYSKDVEPFFAALGMFGFLIGIILNLWDCRNGGHLNQPEQAAATKEEGEAERNILQERLLDGEYMALGGSASSGTPVTIA